MLPKVKNTAFLPGWVDEFFTGNLWPAYESKAGGSMPAVNIQEDATQFKIEVAVPGLDKKDFKVDLSHNVLIISAEKEVQNKEEHKNFTRREFNYTSFKRSFTLPNTVKEDNIKATYKNGILNVILPKVDEAKEKPLKQIEIL